MKAMKRLNIIQRLKFKLDRNSLERLYFSFVLLILEYGDIVWSGACDRDLDKLDQVHVRAMSELLLVQHSDHITTYNIRIWNGISYQLDV